MALVVITVTDSDGEVSIHFSAEPAFETTSSEQTPAQQAASLMLAALAGRAPADKPLIARIDE